MKKRTLQSDSSECKGGGCDAFGNVIEDGASVLGLAYTHDDLSRPIARNDDVFAYNGRSEVAFAEIAGNVEEHAYDFSGNSLWASFNSVTNYYTANNLNQYTAINRTIDQSEQSNNRTILLMTQTVI